MGLLKLTHNEAHIQNLEAFFLQEAKADKGSLNKRALCVSIVFVGKGEDANHWSLQFCTDGPATVMQQSGNKLLEN